MLENIGNLPSIIADFLETLPFWIIGQITYWGVGKPLPKPQLLPTIPKVIRVWINCLVEDELLVFKNIKCLNLQKINFDLNNAYGGTDDELNLKLENWLLIKLL